MIKIVMIMIMIIFVHSHMINNIDMGWDDTMPILREMRYHHKSSASIENNYSMERN